MRRDPPTSQTYSVTGHLQQLWSEHSATVALRKQFPCGNKRPCTHVLTHAWVLIQYTFQPRVQSTGHAPWFHGYGSRVWTKATAHDA